ncbi:acyl-CoA thioesterase [Nocardia stercoris]|uniref:Acyl-CoA thioesterase n=1 Tax=Nocardia stercoris TaxID=2483361 RepID=A0A3M2L395_9NOCA|nr:acyl-CoA thioesterase [Nocardia stercoris]RMI30335.1 acyl-CoA thioesterase [Nocardia stercoris]
MTFSVQIRVRGYELDSLGHVNQSVYPKYAEHARWEYLSSIGIDQTVVGGGTAPIVLEQNIKYRGELRIGDEITVTCTPIWGEGKVFRFEQEIRKADGRLSAEISVVCGVMDLTARKLLPDARAAFLRLSDDPQLLERL